MLESEYGVSSLSVNANNHFGMKCKSDWSGDTYNHISKNDTQTCFKKYATVYDSYKDHSDHIKSRAWYYFLFILPATDYAGWAVGLQKAGYAADPEYAQKLTAVIERCGLHDLDLTPKPTSPLLNGNDINIAVEKSGNINKSFQERQRANRSNGENIGTDANQGNSDYANEQQPQSPFRNVSIGKSDLNSLNMAIGTGAAPQRAMDGEHLPLSGAPAVTIDAQKIEGSIKRTNTESVVAKPASPIRVGTIQDTPAETQVEYRFEETPALNDRYAAPIHNSDVVAQQSQQQQQQTIIANTTTTQPAVQQRTESNYNNNIVAQQTAPAAQMQPMALKQQELPSPAVANYTASNNLEQRPSNIEISYKKPTFENNCKSVTFEVPVMPEKIARMYEIEISLLLKYNHLQDKKQAFPANLPIYLSLPVLNRN